MFNQLSKKINISTDIIINNILVFTIKNFNGSIINDDIEAFLLLKPENIKYDTMISLMLAIEYESINIIKWLFKNEKNKIINIYNEYPLIYYSGNDKINKILEYTNDNYKLFEEYRDIYDNLILKYVNYGQETEDEMENGMYTGEYLLEEIFKLNIKIAENNLIGISLLITIKIRLPELIEDLLMLLVIEHKHIMFNKMFDKYKSLKNSIGYFKILDLRYFQAYYFSFYNNLDLYNLILNYDLYSILYLHKNDKKYTEIDKMYEIDPMHLGDKDEIVDVYIQHELNEEPKVVKMELLKYIQEIEKILKIKLDYTYFFK